MSRSDMIVVIGCSIGIACIVALIVCLWCGVFTVTFANL